ncbi:MAG TPA: hypothetical protein PK771_08195, partial [Spirochaetota bacterium]|nr:hypothetical protein [Spirochaetota bacterium]
MRDFFSGFRFLLVLVSFFIVFACSNPLMGGGDNNDPVTTDTIENVETDELVPVIDKALGSTYPASGSYSPYSMSTWGTATWPRGANKVSAVIRGVTTYFFEFAVYAPSATKVLLEVYGASTTYATGYNAMYDYWMTKGSDGVWRAKIQCASTSTYLYGFRCWGPNWPYNTSWARGNSAAGFISDVDAAGNRFNPNKVLFDPYAKELTHDKENPALVAAGHDGGMFGTGPGLYKGVARRNVDTGKWAPKSVA